MVHPRDLVVGVLGMPDNPGTSELLDYLTHDAGLTVDFVVYWQPSARDQWKRLMRKVRAAGIGPALARVSYALRNAGAARFGGGGSDGGTTQRQIRRYYVPGHNSPECRDVLRKENVDVLLLSTDAIIGKRVLDVPRVVTLNAHPGWVPQYRGLGSNLFMMERGELPAVSVHAVDEGIDTGPVIVRERVEVDFRRGLDHIEDEVDRRRCQLMADVIRQARKGELRFVDTFDEPSNMTRGMPAARRERLDKRLRSGELTLS